MEPGRRKPGCCARNSPRPAKIRYSDSVRCEVCFTQAKIDSEIDMLYLRRAENEVTTDPETEARRAAE